MKQPRAIHCQQCFHYYVTWDVKAPHGCRKLGFKSTLLPNIVVLSSSGTPCLFHEPKHTAKKSSDRKRHTG